MLKDMSSRSVSRLIHVSFKPLDNTAIIQSLNSYNVLVFFHDDDKFWMIQQYLWTRRYRYRDWLSVVVKLWRTPAFRPSESVFPIEMEDKAPRKIYVRQSITTYDVHEFIHNTQDSDCPTRSVRSRSSAESDSVWIAVQATWSAADVILGSPHSTVATFKKKYQSVAS
jgi:hypothetical protein